MWVWAGVLARRIFIVKSFWRWDVLTQARFYAETSWRKNFLAPKRLGAEIFWHRSQRYFLMVLQMKIICSMMLRDNKIRNNLFCSMSPHVTTKKTYQLRYAFAHKRCSFTHNLTFILSLTLTYTDKHRPCVQYRHCCKLPWLLIG